MEIVTLILILVFIATLLFIILPKNAEERRIRSLFRKIPGPTGLPFFGIMMPAILANKVGVSDYVERVVKKHQPMFAWWLGPYPFVDVTKPEIMEVVLRNTEMIDKAFLYKYFHSWLGTGLLTSTGEKWHKHRKIITPTFHFSILDTFLEVFKEKADILVKKLEKEVGGKGFNAYSYVSRCALDIICETAMGTSVNAQADESSSYVTAVYTMTDLIFARIVNPLYNIGFIFKLSHLGRTQTRCLKILQGFVEKVTKERKEKRRRIGNVKVLEDDSDIGRKKRVAFLDMLLDASEAGGNLTDEEIHEEVQTFMFEGHDTVSLAMSWALFELGHRPDIQDKIVEEQNEIFQDSDRVPSMKDLNDMNYLERVIKENLRLHPSVPFFARKTRNDFELNGYKIPGGINMDFPIFISHRNPEVFPNPDDFNPDHFLPERVLNRHPYAYLPFSAGPRNCIGQRFALLEMKTILSNILRKFEFRSLDKRDSIKFAMDVVNRPSGPIRLTVQPRKK